MQDKGNKVHNTKTQWLPSILMSTDMSEILLILLKVVVLTHAMERKECQELVDQDIKLTVKQEVTTNTMTVEYFQWHMLEETQVDRNSLFVTRETIHHI